MLVDMEAKTGSSRWGDVLLVSTTGKGHLTPMLDVANRLLERGVSITLVVTEDERAFTEKKVESRYLKAGGLMNLELAISMSKLEGREVGLLGLCNNAQRVFEPFFQKLLLEKESGAVQGPKYMVTDLFLGWTQAWANKLGIPRYVLFTSPATYAVLMLCHTSVTDQLEHASDRENQDFIVRIPRLPLELKMTDIPRSFLDGRTTRFIGEIGDNLKEAAGILYNTFYELESEAIECFQGNVEKLIPPGKVTKMLPIGPMLPHSFFQEGIFVDETAKNCKCIQWLDTRPASSVLYIAFGSWAYLTPQQIRQLAHALEATQVPFLWILRVEDSPDKPGDMSQLLPPGFGTRTQKQGFIDSEFAPQLQILSHPATGGFLTHCGWNSSMESICRGMPMIGWPLNAEQGLCCRVLVDFAKVAIQVTNRSKGTVATQDIERAIAVLMKEPQGQELKRRAAELQQLARAARSPGGSSHRNFERFVKDIRGEP